MRSWNTHAWYVTGILLALLIGTMSVKWNAVDRLPEMISFAVGLSSLILSLFTIIMTMNNDASATLSAVREAANDIRGTAGEVTSAASDVRSISSAVLESSEANREAISDLASKVKSQAEQTKIEEGSPIGRVTVGSGPAYFAAVKAAQESKPLNFADIFPADAHTDYEEGVLAGLRLARKMDYDYDNHIFTIKSIAGNMGQIAKVLEGVKFTKNESLQSSYDKRMETVKKYFA